MRTCVFTLAALVAIETSGALANPIEPVQLPTWGPPADAETVATLAAKNQQRVFLDELFLNGVSVHRSTFQEDLSRHQIHEGKNPPAWQIPSCRLAFLMAQHYQKTLSLTDAVAIAYCWLLLDTEQPS